MTKIHGWVYIGASILMFRLAFYFGKTYELYKDTNSSSFFYWASFLLMPMAIYVLISGIVILSHNKKVAAGEANKIETELKLRKYDKEVRRKRNLADHNFNTFIMSSGPVELSYIDNQGYISVFASYRGSKPDCILYNKKGNANSLVTSMVRQRDFIRTDSNPDVIDFTPVYSSQIADLRRIDKYEEDYFMERLNG